MSQQGAPAGNGDGQQFSNPETPGYVGFANLPNQVHRKSVKKGFEFTLMVVGESGLGKSTLVNSLFLTDLYPDRLIPDAADKIEQTVKLEESSVEIEERGVRLRLTVVDTPGYGDAIDNDGCFKAIIAYIDDQFEKYLKDESGLNRRNIRDNRVHCCFYFISPTGHGLKPLDVEFMKALHNKVNIVPVIAKSDTLTKKELLRLKQRVMDEINGHGIQTYDIPECESDEDEDFKLQNQQLREAIPFAVCGANQIIEVRGKKVRGRMYPWGVVEVENPAHCDFIKLRTMLITHMQDMQEVTQELHYENYRSEKLARSRQAAAASGSAAATPSLASRPQQQQPVAAASNAGGSKDNLLMQKEEEIRRMREMMERLQAELEKEKHTPPATPPMGQHTV